MMCHSQTHDHRLRHGVTSRRSSSNRSGAAMIVAVVCLTLLSAITISLVRLSMVSQQQVERDQWRQQAAWLAESGFLRAIAQLDAGDPIDTDDWTPTGIGSSSQAGRVTTTVTADPEDESRLTITTTADFPDHPTDRVRTTRVRTINRTTDGNASAEETE